MSVILNPDPLNLLYGQELNFKVRLRVTTSRSKVYFQSYNTHILFDFFYIIEQDQEIKKKNGKVWKLYIY